MRAVLEGRLFGLLAAVGAPATLAALLLLWVGDYSKTIQISLSAVLIFSWVGLAALIRGRIIYQMQTLSNLLAALREGDYAVRVRARGGGDGFPEVARELNLLSDTLHRERLGAVEATALLQKVMETIDVAVFTFDGDGRLRLVNQAGLRLLNKPAQECLGETSERLKLQDCLEGEPHKTLERRFPGGSGRWSVQRSRFREQGLPHDLLVLSDMSRPLREEEKTAWQRLIRVLGHELNNSLTPIQSISNSLERLMTEEARPGDWQDDVRNGLKIISSRTESLSRFMATYAQLARLPEPQQEPVQLAQCIRDVTRLEHRLQVVIGRCPDVTLAADRDQLEQLLINLIRNATEAALQTGGGVEVRWARQGRNVEILILDEGHGLPQSANLFVPFFTTKPEGSGIGLVLCRQIAEAHDGRLTLENRSDGPGCVARLTLPMGNVSPGTDTLSTRPDHL